MDVARQVLSVVGLDQSTLQIDRAKAISNGKGISNCQFSIDDVTASQLEENAFDAAFSLTSFHYFPNDDYAASVVGELLRVVKPGGTILITDVPDKGSPWHWVWRAMRNPDPSAVPEPIEMQPTQSRMQRLVNRLKLMVRRFTGKKVESDNWFWLSKRFFEELQDPRVRSLRCVPSGGTDSLRNYRFDVVIDVQ